MPFDLEKEALLASGVNAKKLMTAYLKKLRLLENQFLKRMPTDTDPLNKAKGLFKWLWKDRLDRYKPRGNFKLNKVIDSQLKGEPQGVGNCLGLTLLYNCLLQRMGIKTEAIYLENAFGVGPHVFSLLQINDTMIDIENILPGGFDYRGHIHAPNRVRWGDKELVAEIYNSTGNLFFEAGELKKALKNYDMALKVNKEHEKARLNKLIVSNHMRMSES